LRYDIVGCGAVVERQHVPVINLLREHDGVAVAGCYDPNVQAAEAIAETVGAERWDTHPEPERGDGVDAVVVATPPHLHGEIAREYIDAGKGALIEKPFTRTESEARSLLDAAREQGVAVAVNQLLRYFSAIDVARTFLRGELDRVSSIEGTEGFRWDWAPASNYVVEDRYGGVIHDTGAHVVDTALYLLGLDSEGSAKARVEEVTKSPDQEPSQECSARLVLGADGREVEAGFGFSRLRPLPRGIRVFGGFGALFVPLYERASILFRDGIALRLGDAEPTDKPADTVGCTLLAHRDFIRRVRDPGVRTRIDGENFLLQMGILEQLHGSNGR
jgi:predicted dehydrogenase